MVLRAVSRERAKSSLATRLTKSVEGRSGWLGTDSAPSTDANASLEIDSSQHRNTCRPPFFDDLYSLRSKGCFTSGTLRERHASFWRQEWRLPTGSLEGLGVSFRSLKTSATLAGPSDPQRGSKSGSENQSTPQAVDPIWNWPNAISMARLLSGPAIGYLILQAQWEAAVISLAISGASDWLDGFIARRFSQGSVVGSYLDPLADKVLICCTVGTLAYEGYLYTPLATLIIGRDIFLVAGAFVLRFRSLDWKWPGWTEFFRTTAATKTPQPSIGQKITTSETLAARSEESENRAHDSARGGKESKEPAAFVQPLYVSKVNTVAQIMLVASCMSFTSLGVPPQEVVLGLGGLTAGLTVASGVAYLQKHKKDTRS